MKAPSPHSDNFRQGMRFSSNSFSKNNAQSENDLNSLSSVDELAEFYDPYSDLNLFLVQKITQEMRHCGNSKKWSLKIQEELLKKISPDFQKKFPHYRLGISALKKTWEKIAYYSQQIQQQKEAITQDGKLNIHFFIRENLKQFTSFKSCGPLHPSHFAHQLAMKMSECIATIDGARPKLDHLTKLIWSIQRHLLCGSKSEHFKSPYDEYDKIDKLIVKTILEITAREPQIGYNELEYKVKEALHSLHELPSFSSVESMIGNVSALLAEKLYSSLRFHDLFSSEQKTAMINFIRRHSCLCKAGAGALQLTELVRRIIALYTLASGLPKNLSDEEIISAVQSSYPIQSSEKPNLPQCLYAFVSAELVLMRNEEYCHSLSFVCNCLLSAYKEAILLPELQSDQTDILEIVIWKTLSEMEGLLEKLPYKNGLRIEDEIANILIENPKKAFSSLVHATVQFFKRTKELVEIKKWPDIERKIHTWVIQGDMLYRGIQLEQDTPLFNLIRKKWHANLNIGMHSESVEICNETVKLPLKGVTEGSIFKKKNGQDRKKIESQHIRFSAQETVSRRLPHHLFVSQICQEYLKQHPELAMYASQLSLRVWILYKYAWYTLFSSKEESSYERFLKWHALSFLTTLPHASQEKCSEKLQEIVKKMLPLIPFDLHHCNETLKDQGFKEEISVSKKHDASRP